MPSRGYSFFNLRKQVFQPFFILQSSSEYVPSPTHMTKEEFVIIIRNFFVDRATDAAFMLERIGESQTIFFRLRIATL